MGSLDDPAGAGLDGGGDALAGDLAVEAQLIEQLPGHGAVVAAVQMAGTVLRKDPVQLPARGLQGGGQQRRVVPVPGRGGDAQRDAVPVAGDRAFQAAFAPVDWGRPGSLAAAGRLGQAPVDRDVAQFQADDLVIGAQRGGVQRLGDARLRPFGQPPPDSTVRAPGGGDPLVPAAVHQRGHDVLEDHPAGCPAAVAAQRVIRLELRGLTAG